MFDDATWAQLNANYNAQKKKKNASNEMPGLSQPRKTFLQDNISTGGGLAGALAGGLGGAAIGAGFGGVGAIPGALIGAILGGFGGGAGGQALENVAVGEDDLSKDVLKEGLINGAFAVGPVRGANVLYQGGRAALQGAGRQGVGQAIETAAAATPIRSTVGKLTVGRGDDLRRGVANTTKVADSYSQELNILDSLNRNGLKGSAANQYKKLDDVLGNISGQIDTTLSTVTKTTPRGSVMAALKKNAAEALPSDSTYTKELTRSLERLSKGGSSKVGPQELFAFKKELAGRLGNAFNKLNKGAPLTAKEEVDMALWRNLDTEITKLAPAVKNMTLDQSNLITARPGLQASSQKTLGIPLLGMKSQSLERGAQKLRDTAGRMADLPANMPRVPGNPTSPLRTAARLGTVGALNSSLSGVGAPQASASEQALSLEQALAGAGGMPQEVEQGPSNPFGVSQDQVAQQMMVAIQNGDAKGYSQLKDLYEMVGEYEASSGGAGGKPTTVEGQKAYNNALSGLSALNDVESMLTKDGSLTWKAALPGGGLTDALLGTSSYEAAVRQAQDAMTRLTTGAALTKEETAALKQRMPKAGDTPETIRYKIAAFRDYFNEVINQPNNLRSNSVEELSLGGGL